MINKDERNVTLSEAIVGPEATLVATPQADAAQEPAEELLDGLVEEVLHPSEGSPVGLGELSDIEPLPGTLLSEEKPVGWLAYDELSPGTKYRLKLKQEKAGGVNTRGPRGAPRHWKAKKSHRKFQYRKNERKAKLERDRWMATAPDGLWWWYKQRKTREGYKWEMDIRIFYALMLSERGGVPLYLIPFDVRRLDISNKAIDLDNVKIVDRETGEILFSKLTHDVPEPLDPPVRRKPGRPPGVRRTTYVRYKSKSYKS